MPNTFVEATGQFHQEGVVRTFELESWKIHAGYEEGYEGTIQRQGDQIVFTTLDDNQLNISDLPDDLPLPLKNVFITGFTHKNDFVWKHIGIRTMGGGGGGGGGMGFHQLNLSSTPVPLPTNIPLPATNMPTLETPPTEDPTTMSIEKVELAYFTPDKRYYPASEQINEPLYLQPVWIFSGHYGDGAEFEFIVQALKDEYLSPQIQPARQPG
jgi:hypothetical protein